jgi:hypothetical protein
MEIYSLPAEDGSRFLVLQDSPPKNGPVSTEGERTIGMLAATFKDTAAANRTGEDFMDF